MEITRLRDRCRDLEERNRKLMADRDGEVRVLKRLLLTKGSMLTTAGPCSSVVSFMALSSVRARQLCIRD